MSIGPGSRLTHYEILDEISGGGEIDRDKVAVAERTLRGTASR